MFVLIVENLLDHRLRALVPRRREPFAFEDPGNTNIIVATVDSGVGKTEPCGVRELPLFKPDRSRHRVKAAKDQVHVRGMVPAPQPQGLGGQADVLDAHAHRVGLGQGKEGLILADGKGHVKGTLGVVHPLFHTRGFHRLFINEVPAKELKAGEIVIDQLMRHTTDREEHGRARLVGIDLINTQRPAGHHCPVDIRAFI